jgi:hypothetical protein
MLCHCPVYIFRAFSVIELSAPPAVHELVYKATLDTSGGGGDFCIRK